MPDGGAKTVRLELPEGAIALHIIVEQVQRPGQGRLTGDERTKRMAEVLGEAMNELWARLVEAEKRAPVPSLRALITRAMGCGWSPPT
jgi:hypothetical protein